MRGGRHGRTWEGRTLEEVGGGGRAWEDMRGHGRTSEDIGGHGRTWEGRTLEDIEHGKPIAAGRRHRDKVQLLQLKEWRNTSSDRAFLHLGITSATAFVPHHHRIDPKHNPATASQLPATSHPNGQTWRWQHESYIMVAPIMEQLLATSGRQVDHACATTWVAGVQPTTNNKLANK